MTNAEQSAYRKLSAPEKSAFQAAFWETKSISPDEYFKRLEFIDANFGSSQRGSGVNTDQGRVYLSLGPPDRLARVPSSRILVPIEIWYYRSALRLGAELQLLFYQRNSVGFPKLYSPPLDTIRALLLNEAATRGSFGPNDSITESGLRGKLNLGPVEDDVFSAAETVSRGVTGTGNDEIISRVTQPSLALARQYHEQVRSRILGDSPPLTVLQTASDFSGMQIDLSFSIPSTKSIDLEILKVGMPITSDRLQLTTATERASRYLYRLDLLPGKYTAVLSIDVGRFSYPLIVAGPRHSEIQRVQPRISPERSAPFVFEGQQLVPSSTGSIALLPMQNPGKMRWRIRKGFEIVWQGEVHAEEIATLNLNKVDLPPGQYRLEAMTPGLESVDTPLSLPVPQAIEAPVISMNANLAPDQRTAHVAHQYLMQGDLIAARNCLDSVTSNNPAVEVERARLEALTGQLDSARARLTAVLSASKRNFEALAVLAFVETQFQDYSVAADYYRRALALQDSSLLREALASLPKSQ